MYNKHKKVKNGNVVGEEIEDAEKAFKVPEETAKDIYPKAWYYLGSMS